VRNMKSLAYRFAYRFNYSTEMGVIYAITQFGPQLIFSIMAARKDTAEELRKETGQNNNGSVRGVFRCSLKVA